jgi:hypothetical protein
MPAYKYTKGLTNNPVKQQYPQADGKGQTALTAIELYA